MAKLLKNMPLVALTTNIVMNGMQTSFTDIKSEKNEKTPVNIFENLKSDYFLQKLYDNIGKKKKLEIVKYNKKIQKRINLKIKDYKEYSQAYSSVEIEIIPVKNIFSNFINIKEKEKNYYHIYFNDSNEEIKNKYSIEEEDEVKIIKVIINYQVQSFQDLFYKCKCIESINFKKFYRNNITNMSRMFEGCKSLKELNLSNFNTNKVISMDCMFYNCSSLLVLNLSNFNTDIVYLMYEMFHGCESLKELNLSNFNTSNVQDMSSMFSGCKSLKELNLSNFNTNIVYDMSSMFAHCSSLKKLDLSNFNTNKVTNMSFMFYECSKLKSLNLSNFNFKNVESKFNMFSGCLKLKSENIETNDNLLKDVLENYF